MSGRTLVDGDRYEAGRYEIRLKGHLDTRWAAWFDGLSLTHHSDGTTVIHGPVADQAALHGLLQKVRDTDCRWSRSSASSPTHPVFPPLSLDRHLPTHERKTAMTNAARTTATKRVPMDAHRKTALAVGVLFILTFITSIGGVLAYGPVLSDPTYITGAGADTRVFFGAFLELFLIITNIGCAVVLFPLLKR